ncbi:MAG TPA: membrane protein insertase YidC [Opitutales bacterium]|jgi:YidC/Oxa1 family membrane protein insertase|nr:membrane protein insertase YidC [Opitutales bacterium]
MDKKYTIFGIICLVAAVLLGVQSIRDQQKVDQYKADHPELYAAAPAAPAVTSGNETAMAPTAGTAAAAGTAAGTSANGTASSLTTAEPEPTTPASTIVLHNDNVEVTFTEDGGAIKTVAMIQKSENGKSKYQYPATNGGSDPVMFNDGAPLPALALTHNATVAPGAPTGTFWLWNGSSAAPASGNPVAPLQPLLKRYTLSASATTPTSVTFNGTTSSGLEITRTYTLSSGNEDPYLIHHTTTFVNHGTNPASLSRVFVNTGMAPPLPPGASSISMSYLDFGYYDGSAVNYVTVQQFMPTPAMFFGLRAAQPKQKDDVYMPRPAADLQWVSAKNPFFATVLMPKDVLGQGFYVRGVDVPVDGTNQTTITGDLELNLGVLAPGETKTLALNYYVGPKEYVRLDKLGDHQDLIMQFGWFSTFTKILLVILIGIHKAIAPLLSSWAWGWTIIVFTLSLKLLTWPLTAIQVRSAKRMSQFSGPMKALREKYKDNPEKLSSEMMKLYKEHKINPAAGCLPMLITFPVFIAFNFMMRTASEMRFQPFLWMHDLSAPDTIAHIGSMPVNLLPLIMTGTMMLQMHLTPSPTTDNTQRNIMKFMPLLFLFGFYPMPSGMILYWTCNNLFTIFQQYVTNRRPDPVTAAPAPKSDLPKAKWR